MKPSVKGTSEKGAGVMPAPPGMHPVIARLIEELWLRLQMDYDLWHARQRLKAEAAKIKPAPREPKEV